KFPSRGLHARPHGRRAEGSNESLFRIVEAQPSSIEAEVAHNTELAKDIVPAERQQTFGRPKKVRQRFVSPDTAADVVEHCLSSLPSGLRDQPPPGQYEPQEIESAKQPGDDALAAKHALPPGRPSAAAQQARR